MIGLNSSEAGRRKPSLHKGSVWAKAHTGAMSVEKPSQM